MRPIAIVALFLIAFAGATAGAAGAAERHEGLPSVDAQLRAVVRVVEQRERG